MDLKTFDEHLYERRHGWLRWDACIGTLQPLDHTLPNNLVSMADYAKSMAEAAPFDPRWATIIGQNGTWAGYVFESCFRGEVIIFGAPFRECFGEQDKGGDRVGDLGATRLH